MTGEAGQLLALLRRLAAVRVLARVDAAVELGLDVLEAIGLVLGVVVVTAHAAQGLVGGAVRVRVAPVILLVAAGARQVGMVGAGVAVRVYIEVPNRGRLRVPEGDGLHPVAYQAGLALALDPGPIRHLGGECSDAAEEENKTQRRPGDHESAARSVQRCGLRHRETLGSGALGAPRRAGRQTRSPVPLVAASRRTMTSAQLASLAPPNQGPGRPGNSVSQEPQEQHDGRVDQDQGDG